MVGLGPGGVVTIDVDGVVDEVVGGFAGGVTDGFVVGAVVGGVVGVVDDGGVVGVVVGPAPHPPTMDGTASAPLPMATRLLPQFAA